MGRLVLVENTSGWNHGGEDIYELVPVEAATPRDEDYPPDFPAQSSDAAAGLREALESGIFRAVKAVGWKSAGEMADRIVADPEFWAELHRYRGNR